MDKAVHPDEKALSIDLGDSKAHLDRIASVIESEFGDFHKEWKFYNAKSGWILKMFSKKRNVLFVIPGEGVFRIAITFGQKAADEVMTAEFPDALKEELRKATKYAEGRTIQLEVRTKKQLEVVLKLIRIKLTT
jgi:hypothetical protein